MRIVLQFNRFTTISTLNFLTIIVSFFVFSSADAGPCAGLNTSQAYIECVNQRMREMEKQLSEPAQTIQQITNGQYEIFKAPRKHHPGVQHDQMYRSIRNGQSYLIKVLHAENVNDIAFSMTLYGALLAEELGGPKVTRAGALITDDSKKALYLEMEEIFAGDPDTFTLKGILYQPWDPRRFLPISLNARHMQKLAKMFVRNLELQVVFGGTEDIEVDLIFSKNDVRWIDTEFMMPMLKGLPPLFHWRYPELLEEMPTSITSSFYRLQMSLERYLFTIANIHSNRSKLGAVLWQHFHIEILNSEVWSDLEKQKIWKSAQERMSEIHPSEKRMVEREEASCQRKMIP